MKMQLIIDDKSNAGKRKVKAMTDKQLLKTVYVDFPEDTPLLDINKVQRIKNVDDMMLLSHQTAAEFSFEKSDLTRDSIYISENEVKIALNPMVKESKEYLYGKGFTDYDIDEMLRENNADETALVTFVLALIEREQTESASLAKNTVIYPLLFATSAQAVSVNWSKAGNCALSALGFDIFTSLGHSQLKTWGVRAMKKAFTAVAKRMVGPIGALIFVGEFSICYFN